MTEVLTLATSMGGFGAGAGLAFFAVKWLFEYLGGRMDKRADRLDAASAELMAQLQAEVKALTAAHKETRDRLRVVETELIECTRKHAASDAEVIRLNAKVEALEASK